MPIRPRTYEIVKVRRCDSRLNALRDDNDPYKTKQSMLVLQEAPYCPEVFAPENSPFMVIPGLDQQVKNDIKKSRNHKIIGIVDETIADYMMSQD